MRKEVTNINARNVPSSPLPFSKYQTSITLKLDFRIILLTYFHSEGATRANSQRKKMYGQKSCTKPLFD